MLKIMNKEVIEKAKQLQYIKMGIEELGGKVHAITNNSFLLYIKKESELDNINYLRKLRDLLFAKFHLILKVNFV